VETVYFLCARRVLVDTSENDVSAIALLEDFTAGGFPLILPRLALIWALRRESDEPASHAGTIKVNIDDDSPIINSPFSVEFQDQLTTRATLNFLTFAIPRPGKMNFHCSLENGHIAEFSIRVDQASGAVGLLGHAPSPFGSFLSP